MSKVSKKSRDYSSLTREDQRLINRLSEEEIEEFGGVFGGVRKQPMTKRLTVPSERIVGEGVDNNAFIIVGNDRVSSPHTGYGGKGHTQCDAIDIVVGLGGHSPQVVEEVEMETIDGEEEEREVEVQTNPNFFLDSARIYISQKTDVDKNFGIGNEYGKTQSKATDDSGEQDDEDIGIYGAKSAIALKADNIRIIGRESIKIVTGTDQENSQGGNIGGKHGVEIIAMNESSKLQPLVLGDNLEEVLIKLASTIESTMEIFEAQMHHQLTFNKAMAQHNHITPFFAIKDLPSEQALAGGISCDLQSMINTELSCMAHVSNIKGIINNYLVPSGPKYILSPHNKTN